MWKRALLNEESSHINNNINTHKSCKNCGKIGHLFNSCKLPILSYGIICFRILPNNNCEYLMINKRHSYGYIDFIKGNYTITNILSISSLINQMTLEEKQIIYTKPFRELWCELWNTSIHNNTYISAEYKFNKIKPQLHFIILNSKSSYLQTEWEFPKGHKNIDESDLDCAFREFTEETGIQASNIILFNNILPFEEIYYGTNYKMYKHKYYIGYIPYEKSTNINLLQFQQEEVANLKWISYNNAQLLISDLFIEKKQMLSTVNLFTSHVIDQFNLNI